MIKTGLVWFRRDLRLGDNPALARAIAVCERVVPVYVHAPGEEDEWAPGAASRWWLHHSLVDLDTNLRARGSRLVVRSGTSLAQLLKVAHEATASHVFWNRLYEPRFVTRDREVKRALREAGLQVESCNGSLLVEPWDLLNGKGQPYRVFTPFWKACVQREWASPEDAPPRVLPDLPGPMVSDSMDGLQLLPRIPWDGGLRESWAAGERNALGKLDTFLESSVGGYTDGRDRPAAPATSRLSPHLHFGEISPRRIAMAVQRHAETRTAQGTVRGTEVFLRELGWREFAVHLLYHFPHTAERPLDPRFEAFPWATDFQADLGAWQRGCTGIPLVDAGMRELWRTGWMHNRVRMVAASLLTKNLLIPWQVGARWFWDTLVDADLASNTLGWQWTAGCGADAAPYFRIFNPVLQSERFDPRGDYVRRWVPELAELPDKFLHKPWTASDTVLRDAGLALGREYPRPVVDLAVSRKRALARFERVKNAVL